MLSVSDTGVGMDDATRQQIFEPFFTTKDVGKGTGLGLSTGYGVVKQSEGSVSVSSEVGTGTEFRIFLPRFSDTRPAVSAKRESVPRGTETILIVEDEQSLLNLTGRILQSAGYTVLEAASGAEALRIVATHPDRIHLVLTDVVMPGMGGRELASRLADANPDIRVVFTSGYTDDDVLRQGVRKDPSRFISKPYTAATLNREVRNLLDEPVSGPPDASR
jgi:CheY-like chemotaxis protein